MQRWIANTVLVVLLCSWCAPLFAAVSSRSLNELPACCRRNGNHHCMMRMMMEMQSAPGYSAPYEKCPYSSRNLLPCVTSAPLFAPPAHQIFYAAVQSHPVVVAQTEARYRISCDRSRLKRGPPASTPLFHS